MIEMPRRRVLGAALFALALPATAAAQERYEVRGERVAIFNLAGEVEVTGASGGDVVVEVARGGGEADQLRVEVGEVSGGQALRVIYPSDRVHYDPDGWNGSTQLRVSRQGTWGDEWGGGGDRVRVSSRDGLDAHADLRIAVPRGQRVDVYLAVGRIVAENVNGRVRLDTHAGRIEARRMAGSLILDTGSGSVEVAGMEGDLSVDTGSGSVSLAGVRGERVGVDTGSGGVDAEGVEARSIELDTGSGSIRLRASAADDLRLDTGSGSVVAELTADVERLVVDTGSGSVTLRLPEELGARLEVETGSGGIDVDFPVMVTRRTRDELTGQIGDGRGTIRVDTGSGGVRLLKG